METAHSWIFTMFFLIHFCQSIYHDSTGFISLCQSTCRYLHLVHLRQVHQQQANSKGAHMKGVYAGTHERVNPIFSTVLSQNSKLLVITQLHPRSTEHLMSNIHLHNTIQHAFAALMQVQTSHLCIVILSRTSCTHHHHQRRRQ